MPTKTILHLTGMHSKHYGAKEQYFLEFAQACRERGYQNILQYESVPWSPAYLRDLKKFGVSLVVLPTRRNPFWAIPKVTALLYSTRPEIVETHFVNRYIRLATPIITRKLGTRKSIAFVRTMPYKSKFGLRQFMYNRYDHVLAISKAIAGDLILRGVNPEIVSIHYWGIIGRREKSEQLRAQFREEFGIPEQAVVIGVITFNAQLKGLDILLEAFAKIIPGYSQIHLLVIGVDPNKTAFPEQASRLGISDRVYWTGIRDHGWQLLNAADIYVQPSRREGLGVAIIEAMSLKLPTVGTRTGGIPEIIIDGETGCLAEPDSVDSLVAALERILREPSQWKTMGEAGYQRYVNIFDGKKSVKLLIEKYFDLCD